MTKLLEKYSNQKEEEIRNFWKEKNISEKARAQNQGNEKTFYFMDGPPYATGNIHMGTALNKILKDIAMRYYRANGCDVFDRPGYDTHGLPIEHAVEKELGFKNKNNIEEYGVGKFVEKCRNYATKYIDVMSGQFDNLGVWMDWKDPYITLQNTYIEAIWHSFKKADEKGLLYLGKYPGHVCPRCETAVAFNEIEYTKRKDMSVFVKFPLKDEENTYLIVWTTTPWTLPANTGVMVHPQYDYSYVKMSNGEKWIIAKELVQKFMTLLEAGYSIEKDVKGKELDGLIYVNPIQKHLNWTEEDMKNGYRVILNSRYVNLEEGSGLVHTAPGHGKEDFDAGTKAGLPVLSPLNLDGSFTEKAGKYAGKKAKIVDDEIIADYEEMNMLPYKHPYTHDYPVCWRCKTPLLMFSTPQWFFKVSEIREKMKSENREVYWVPGWMQDRFANWCETLGDWPLSRKRYWGAPLPIWMCECGEKTVIGSIKELMEKSGLEKEIDLHKPGIDNVTIKCKCGKEQKRVTEVLDVWFDSGVSSWAALGYPQRTDLFEKFWPADLNIEGTDQVRGWWNSQMITSLICFDEKPFKSIAVHGMVLGMGKIKMSKSLGNTVQPKEVIEKFNRDYLRYFLAGTSKGEDFMFEWNQFNEIGKFFNVFWNSLNFVNLYLETDFENAMKIDANILEPEDKWIVSRFNSLVKASKKNFEKYLYAKIVADLEQFVLVDLSRTYIKLIRGRTGTESEQALKQTMNYILFGLTRLMAPIVPHVAEFVYQNTKKEGMEESIHFYSFPEVHEKNIILDLENEMSLVADIAQSVLALREENKLRLRWPLKKISVQLKDAKLDSLKKVLAKMVNVKNVETTEKAEGNSVKDSLKYSVSLDTDADAELKQEWVLRELTRKIQSKRKEMKLNPNNTITMEFDCSDKAFLEKFKSVIEQETSTKIVQSSGEMEKVLDKDFFIRLKP